MKSKEIVRRGVIVAVTAIALSTSACYRSHSPAERAEWMANKVTKELSLNEPQKVKLEAVKQAFLAAQGEMKAQHQAMFDEVLTQVPADRLDQTKLLQLFEQHQLLATRLAPSVLNKVAEFHATLTPQQKAEAVERLAKFRAHA